MGNRTEIDGADALNLHDEFPFARIFRQGFKCLAFYRCFSLSNKSIISWQTCCYHEIQNAEQGGVQLRQGPKRT